MPQGRKKRPISLRAYAKRRGVSHEAVRRAIESGRLSASVVTVGGQPKIEDADLADREWDANTQPRVDQPTTARPAASLRARGATDADQLAASEDDPSVPNYFISRAFREAAAARREAALADLAELEAAERAGALIPADEVAAAFVEEVTAAKTKLLGVPKRAKQRLPHLSAADVRTIDELIREALEDLAKRETATDG